MTSLLTNSNVITPVLDGNRLHVGYGKEEELPNQLGSSIKVHGCSYGNLVGRSFSLQIGGKTYYVNKTSFYKHYKSIGGSKAELDVLIRDGSSYEEMVYHKDSLKKLCVSTEKLVDHISHETRLHLFGKMLQEVENGNTKEVKELVRKGAYIDKEYYVVPDFPTLTKKNECFLTIEEVKKFLDKKRIVSCKACTPMVLAAEKSNGELTEFFYQVKLGQIDNDRIDTVIFSNDKISRYTTHQLVMVDRNVNSDDGAIEFKLARKKQI